MSEPRIPDDLADATTLAAGSEPSLPGQAVTAKRPATIGRFIVLDVLGSGGMGVVYAAYDPTLDRRIAVKLVRPRLDSGQARGNRERLLREARALARIEHPAILTVHDAGLVDGQVFIATELVSGGTLRAWQEAEPRERAAILAAYVAAGRGLAAAHVAGLVHRDFKPDNVLRTADGRVRVADFGLVGGAVSGAVSDDGEPDPGDGRLTATGAVMGTPRYMAPEQHRGEDAGPAADQFAFCVALWEALTGARPFPGESAADIAARIEAGPPGSPSTARGVPSWLTATLTRGLALEPAARWPSMTALVAALEDDPESHRRRRWRIAATVAVAAALIAAVVVLATSPRPDAAATCDGGSAHLDQVWSPIRADAVQAGFGASGLPYAPAVAGRVVAAIDARVGAWRDARRTACRATRATGEQSEALLDRRMSCLDRRLDELDALVRGFAATGPGDRAIVDGAVVAVAALPALEACADTRRLGEITPPPADAAARARIAALFARIAAPAPGRVFNHAPAVVEAGYAALQALAPEVKALHYPPLDGALALRLAELAPPAAAEAHLRDALAAAAMARDDGVAAEAWSELVRVIGVTQHRHGEAELLRVAAEAASARAGRAPDDDPELLDGLSEVAHQRGDFAAARDLAARALAAAEHTMAADDPRLGRFLADLATSERFAGHFDVALALQQRALALHTRILGADHPATIYDHALIATLLGMLGRTDEALAIAQEMRQHAPRVLGADHPYSGAAHLVLGETLSELERHGEALTELRAAVAIFERALGAEDRETVNARSVMASELSALGRHDEALAMLRAVVASHELALGASHPRVAQALLDLGSSMMRAGRFDDARPVLDRALQIADASLGPRHTLTLGMITARAKADLFSDHTRDALPFLERAVALADETLGIDHPRSSMVRFDIVLARWDLGQHEAARELAREIVPRLRAAGGRGAVPAATIERWLAAHP